MDLNFEQMLAQHNQEYKESEVYSDWMPDDGEYIVSLIKLAHDTKTTKDGTLIWWRLTGRIEDVQDAKINGKEFSVGYYTSKAFGILKGAVNALSGQQIDDLGQAHAILEASIGLVIRAKVRTSRSKKDGKDYTNCYILEVINTTEATPTEGIPETVAPGGPDGVYTADDSNVAVANGDGATPVEVSTEVPIVSPAGIPEPVVPTVEIPAEAPPQ